MDNNRPSLDMKHFDDICPDKNGMSKTQLYTLRAKMRNFSKFLL
jgi:hypothetical protein